MLITALSKKGLVTSPVPGWAIQLGLWPAAATVTQWTWAILCSLSIRTGIFYSNGWSVLMLVAMSPCEVKNTSQTGFADVTCHLSCCRPQQTSQITVLEACHTVLEVTRYHSPSWCFTLLSISSSFNSFHTYTMKYLTKTKDYFHLT